MDLLLHAAVSLAAAGGPDGGALGVPQPLPSVHAGAPWPPLDALHCLLNAMYSKGARFGADAAGALRSAVTSVRERIAAEDDPAGGMAAPAAPPAAAAPQPSAAAHTHGYDEEDADYAAAADAEADLLYGRGGILARGAGGGGDGGPVPTGGAGFSVRSLLAAGAGGGR